MIDKNKVLYVDASFEKELGDDSLFIAGYASTTDIDRANDVVAASVWKKGMKQYLKNPIILAQHNHDEPIGEMVEHEADDKGLWIKARISPAAKKHFGLIKDGVLKAFSIGFRVLDATYDQVSEVFVIKEVELTEISVVAVGCNPNTLFSLSKSFENDNEYSDFKKQFAPDPTSANGLDNPTAAKSIPSIKEFSMNEDEIKALVAKAASDAATAALADKAKADAAIAADAAQKAANDKAIEDKVKEALKSLQPVQTVETGAEKLLKELTARIEAGEKAHTDAIKGLEGALAEKAAELEAVQKSKMTFGSDAAKGALSYHEKEMAYLLGHITGKGLMGTEYAKRLVEKAGPHVPGAIPWELEVSRTMEEEIRRKLVFANTLRNVTMQTNVMTMPVNPEAGVATWVTNAQFGTTASAGAAQTHQLKEITLNAYKVATTEYLNYEEPEDSLLILLPTIRDAMIRRVAKAVDKAFVLGAGTGGDPVKGLAAYDTTSAVVGAVATKVTVANMIALRRDLGTWGLDPSELILAVSNDVYYDLMEDPIFQTVDKIGIDKSTLRTGQIGSIGNTPVLVSSALAAKNAGAVGALTNVGAVIYHPGNFIVGNQRGLRFDTQDLVETQRKVMVASLRTGMTQVTTNEGIAISAFRWTT
jgi:HK97 family phage prohead protease/HK97 family phage major capsid protein